MTIDFGWFLPTMGDTEIIGPPTREATADYLTKVAKTAEDAGFVSALVPVGTTCEDAWLASSVVAARTDKLKFLVAMRPGFIAPTVAAKMSNTLDQLTRGRVLINVVTGGFPAELAADGDFTEHDDRYVRTQEFMQVVRKAWTEPRSWHHEGRFYRVEKGNVFPRPYQQLCPPFYFGGASDAAKQVGAIEYGMRPLFASLDGVPIAGVYATDDQFVEGRPAEKLLARIETVVAAAVALAALA